MGERIDVVGNDAFWADARTPSDILDAREVEGSQAYDAFTADTPADMSPSAIIDSLGPVAKAPINEFSVDQFLGTTDAQDSEAVS